MNIIKVYDKVKFRINPDQNGGLTIAKFNETSELSELRLLDWLSGDISNEQAPIPYLSQKNRDWLSPLITPANFQVSDGIIVRPADYYGFENMFRIGSRVNDCDEDEEEEDECNTVIDLLSNSEFNRRCKSHIKGLKPSMAKPYIKQVGKRFHVAPKTLGSVTLEYIRYPKYGRIIPMEDTVYKNQVPDPNASVNYEWDDNVMDILVWLIADEFSNHTRENALKQMNAMTGKQIRDQKK